MSLARATTDPRLRRPPDEALAWAARAVGPRARVLGVSALRGGISHANHALRIEQSDGPSVRVVLRRWVREDWRIGDPSFSPEQEAATYGLLAGSSIVAPRLVDADPRGTQCDVPALLLTLAPGRPPPDTRPPLFVDQLATAIAAVHAVDATRAGQVVPTYRPYYDHTRLAAPAWARRPATFECAIAAVCSRSPADAREPVLIHRDFHPGNTLWRRGRLTAIVDWTTASLGQRAMDLAHLRANLAMTDGHDLADQVVDAYRRHTGIEPPDQPWWDLRVAVDLVPDLPSVPVATPELRRLETFVESALGSCR